MEFEKIMYYLRQGKPVIRKKWFERGDWTYYIICHQVKDDYNPVRLKAYDKFTPRGWDVELTSYDIFLNDWMVYTGKRYDLSPHGNKTQTNTDKIIKKKEGL